jgi:hypothetical protein
MAAHASGYGYPSNIRRRRGKRHIFVMMIVGGFLLVIGRILVVFLPYKSYGVGGFVHSQTLIGVQLLMFYDSHE